LTINERLRGSCVTIEQEAMTFSAREWLHLVLWLTSLSYLGGCSTGTANREATPLPEAARDRVTKKLDERSLSAEAFERVLVERGIQAVRTPPAGMTQVCLPFQMADGVPVVRCSINGHRSVPMIFDTGASHTMINATDAVKGKLITLRADAGAVPMIGVMGIEQGRFAMMESLDIGPWRVRGYPCLVRQHPNAGESKVAAHLFRPNLLGFDLALESASYLIVDYRKREVIYGFGRFDPPSGERAVKSPFKLIKGVPFTRIRVGSRAWDALLDTGSFNGIEIGAGLAEELGVHRHSQPVEGVSVFGVGGTMTAGAAGLRTTTAADVEACGVKHDSLRVDIAPGAPRVGSFFLKDYRMSIDLRRRELWLER
jgi:hypothetical protein